MIKHSKNIVYILVIMIVLGIVLGFKLINKKVSPIMMKVAEDEAKRLSDVIINDAVKKELDNGLSFDKLFITTYENDNVATIDFDSIIVNRVLSNVTNNILVSLKAVEDGDIEKLEMLNEYNQKKLKKGIIYEVPLAYSYNNVFLSNLSPKIPVKIHMLGNINSNIRTKVTDYGINNALIEVYIDIEVNMQVILPILSNKISNNASIPIAIKLIKGNIPEYFSNAGSNNSMSIPIE